MRAPCKIFPSMWPSTPKIHKHSCNSTPCCLLNVRTQKEYLHIRLMNRVDAVPEYITDNISCYRKSRSCNIDHKLHFAWPPFLPNLPSSRVPWIHQFSPVSRFRGNMRTAPHFILAYLSFCANPVMRTRSVISAFTPISVNWRLPSSYPSIDPLKGTYHHPGTCLFSSPLFSPVFMGDHTFPL